MGLKEVSRILWQERELLELLQFKLEEERLVLAAGRSEWITHATGEVEMVLDRIREIEAERMSLVAEVAPDLGLGSNPSLRELIEAAPPEWRPALEEHRDAFATVTRQVADLTAANRELLGRGLRAVREAILAVSDAAGSQQVDQDLYAKDGRERKLSGVGPRILDRTF